jgi:hypothetical protein
MAGGILAIPGRAGKAPPVELAGVACQTPPPLHCPDQGCAGATVIEQGTAVEPKTGRRFFLDYPCDLKRGEKVTFILSLHGGGSYGNWQRHYFPILDYKEKYRLVIATPNSPVRVWSANDDEYLRNIVELVYQQVGAKNVKAFWLAGHSQGGLTSNRLLRTEYFRGKVNGWVSLSGGRLGPAPPIAPSFFTGAQSGRGGAAAPAAPSGGAGGGGRAGGGRGPGGAPAGLPDADFSFIFETGEHEIGGQPIPAASPWAAKYGCAERVRRADVIDTKAGYVYDSTRQNPGSDAWGRLPRPGRAEVSVYPKCKGGRVVADVVRIGKGHTEGLEPAITEQIVKLMLAAKK